jgi:hypothetical protein
MKAQPQHVPHPGAGQQPQVLNPLQIDAGDHEGHQLQRDQHEPEHEQGVAQLLASDMRLAATGTTSGAAISDTPLT